jgi:Concanavalin A-like lectin/glucanases superfamily
VLIAALYPSSSFSFPVYLTSNGTTLVNSAFGSNVVLGPDAGGQVLASALLNATSGIALNSTLLNEPLVQGLLTTVSTLSVQLATLLPPSCNASGGAVLWNGASWACTCIPGWSGTSCGIPPAFGGRCLSTTHFWPLNMTFPATDIITNAQSAVLSGTVTYTNSSYVQAILFDGQTTGIVLPSVPISLASIPFSFSLWLLDLARTGAPIFSYGRNSFAAYGNMGSSNVVSFSYDGSIFGTCPSWSFNMLNDALYSSRFPNSGQWNHLVVTVGGTANNARVNVYLNGKTPFNAPSSSTYRGFSVSSYQNLAYCANNVDGLWTTPGQVAFGFSAYPYVGSFSGSITGFQTFNTELSAAAVANLTLGLPC